MIIAVDFAKTTSQLRETVIRTCQMRLRANDAASAAKDCSMDVKKTKRLPGAGWRVASASEFLN